MKDSFKTICNKAPVLSDIPIKIPTQEIYQTVYSKDKENTVTTKMSLYLKEYGSQDCLKREHTSTKINSQFNKRINKVRFIESNYQ